jgi:Domain of unknown function (DUF305)
MGESTMEHDHRPIASHPPRDLAEGRSLYGRLLWMTALSFVTMYVLMYAMVDVVGNVYLSFTQFYMAGLMAAPMAAIELSLMRSMYPNKRLNTLVFAASAAAALVFFLLIRQQTGISDRQFLRSMIPHHAAALLMCERAPVEDAQIQDLCGRILSSQQAEIDEMKAKLQELEG